jgi:hypothetical protein
MRMRVVAWRCIAAVVIFAAGVALGVFATRHEEPSRAASSHLAADRPTSGTRVALPEENEIEQAWAVVYNPLWGGQGVPLFEIPTQHISAILDKLRPYMPLDDDEKTWRFCALTGETGMIHFDLRSHRQIVIHWYNTGHSPLHFSLNGKLYMRTTRPEMRDHALELEGVIGRIYEAMLATKKPPELIADPSEETETIKKS